MVKINKKLIIFLIILGIITILLGSCAVGCGLIANSVNETNDKNESVDKIEKIENNEEEEKEVAGKITSVNLWKEYDNNEIKANNKYNNKKYEITGKILDLDITFGQMSVTLIGDGLFSNVKLNINDEDETIIASLEKNNEITVEGIIKGISFVDIQVDNIKFIKY